MISIRFFGARSRPPAPLADASLRDGDRVALGPAFTRAVPLPAR